MSRRQQPNIIPDSEPTSSDVEEDHLHQNLNEFERNILSDEGIDINKDHDNGSNTSFSRITLAQNRRLPSSYQMPGMFNEIPVNLYNYIY